MLMRYVKVIPLFLCLSILASAQSQTERAAIDWIFLLDTSKTMLGQGKAQGKNIFADVKQSMHDFLNNQVQVGDSVQLIPFDSQSRPAPPTFIGTPRDKEYVRRAITDVPAKGNYTYIAEAIQTARYIIQERTQSPRGAATRKYAVIIFTDGIDEPPPNARDRVDLKSALLGFPERDALFYFVNLGDTSSANTLYGAMTGNTRFKENIENSPRGENVAEAVARILGKIERETAEKIEVAIDTRKLDKQLPVAEAVEISPFHVRSSGPGQVKFEFDATKGLSVRAKDAPFFDVGKDAVAPPLIVEADQSLNDASAILRVRVVPVGRTILAGEPPTGTLTLQFHQPTALERALPWLIALFILAALALASWLFYKRWNIVPLEGLLYVRDPGKSQERDPIDLKSYKKPEISVGGPGADLLPEQPGFRFVLRAEGSGGRVRQVVIIRQAGEVAVNGLEHVTRVYNEDEIEASGYRFKYENFKLPQRQA